MDVTKYPDSIEKIKSLYDKIKSCNLSEIDTQVLLIEPVLVLCGWDIFDPNSLKRANRSAKNHQFDIEIYNDEKMFIAIECKSLSSKEFNIGKIKSRNGIGKLIEKPRKWKNKDKDGTGQLRAYCSNYSQYDDSTLAVLTNGFDWVIFDHDKFTREENLLKPIDSDCIAAHNNLNDSCFETQIIAKLKKPN